MADQTPGRLTFGEGRLRPARPGDTPHRLDRRADLQREVRLVAADRHRQRKVAIGAERVDGELPQIGAERRLVGIDERQIHLASDIRSEEHTSELQSLMRTSYAVFCLKKKNNKNTTTTI